MGEDEEEKYIYEIKEKLKRTLDLRERVVNFIYFFRIFFKTNQRLFLSLNFPEKAF